jgi:hypothetical protein
MYLQQAAEVLDQSEVLAFEVAVSHSGRDLWPVDATNLVNALRWAASGSYDTAVQFLDKFAGDVVAAQNERLAYGPE